MTITKTEYILKSLKKTLHKDWELFVISRIIHQLDDDIEFVRQQLVRGRDGRRYLTDLYFPQFSLHLEVDERYHLKNEELDRFREMDIIQETSHEVPRIKTFSDDLSKEALDHVRHETDLFVQRLLEIKEQMLRDGRFRPWNWEERYSSEAVIRRGYLDVDDNVTFRLQVDALRCFGFEGKGWQKGAWRIKDKSGDWVWFPRLYPHDDRWSNELTADGAHIFQRAISDQALQHNASQNEKARLINQGNVIVFAKAKDALGGNVLRYVGTFRHNLEASNDQAVQFDRVKTREKVRRVFNRS